MTQGSLVRTTSVDLRSGEYNDVIERVEQSLRVRLDRTTVVRKRRSFGFTSDHGTWVRIEARNVERIAQQGQGWNGIEAAAVLCGIAKPVWHQSVSWSDNEQGMMWRADETTFVTAPPIKSQGGTLVVDPGLPDSWWATLKDSLGALASAATTRVATLHTAPITQARVTSTIEGVFLGAVDTGVDEWTVAHADLTWANLTGPECFLLDWEDWGTAPRGLDAAMLWANSLAVRGLADRVYRELAADLGSRSGKVLSLFFCASIIGASGYDGPLREPAVREAERLISELSS